MSAPAHRVRGKSAPRGRSPNPKDLKRAEKKVKGTGLITPPPKLRAPTPSSTTPTTTRKLSFSDETKVHEIEAENSRKGKRQPMKSEHADAIFNKLKKDWG